jgi:polyisoprenoid-binding protein YceI
VAQQDEATSSSSARFDSAAGTWLLDPVGSSVSFDTKAMWLIKVHGTIPAVEGSAAISEDGQLVEGRLVLDATHVDTGTAKRDAHLRTKDFFDTETHPSVVFIATNATPVGGHVDQGTVDVDGKLTIGDQTRPITIRGEVKRDGDVATVTASFSLDRRDWGLTWAKMGAGVLNDVRVDARFIRGVAR